MKKILAIGLVGAALTLFSCQDQLESEFYNPETYQAPEDKLSSGMFTQTLYQWQVYIQDYGDWWWGLGGWSPTSYAQVSVRPLVTPYETIYAEWDDVTTGNSFSADSHIRNYFNSMYTKMRTWPIMKDLVENKYKGDVLNNNYIYYQLITTIKDYVILKNVDIFNSIPYKNALKGNEGVLFAEYDDPQEIYKTILTELEGISSTLVQNYNKMSPESKKMFEKQDIAFKGNIQTWKEYVNALRLKYAVRMSGSDETFAKTQIASAIAGGLPTVDMAWDIPFAQAKDLPGGGTIVRGWFERFTTLFIPNIILERMNHNGSQYTPGVDDPRLPAIAAPTRYNDYRGVRMDNEFTTAEYNKIIDQKESERPAGMSDVEWARTKYYFNRSSADRPANGDLIGFTYNCISMYNPATYMYCDVPAYMMSIAETDLLLAEVAAKKLAVTGKTAGQHLADAVTHSTDFWYKINSKSIVSKDKYPKFRPDKPASSDISTYATWLNSEFDKLGNIEDQMEMIMQQKYIHLNLFNSIECWTELRRTRHPKLEPLRFTPHFQKSTPMVERIKYPDSEEQTNTDNFLKVKDANNYTSPIFWVPQAKRAESYYSNTYVEIESRN